MDGRSRVWRLLATPGASREIAGRSGHFGGRPLLTPVYQRLLILTPPNTAWISCDVPPWSWADPDQPRFVHISLELLEALTGCSVLLYQPNSQFTFEATGIGQSTTAYNLGRPLLRIDQPCDVVRPPLLSYDSLFSAHIFAYLLCDRCGKIPRTHNGSDSAWIPPRAASGLKKSALAVGLSVNLAWHSNLRHARRAFLQMYDKGNSAPHRITSQLLLLLGRRPPPT